MEGPDGAIGSTCISPKVGLDVTHEGIAIIPVIRKGNLAKWWRLFTAYKIPTYVIFDNYKRDDENGVKRMDVLKTLYVDEREWKRYLQTNKLLITSKFAVFGTDFETTMRNLFSNYSMLEKQAREIFGDSKPIIARFVAYN